MCGLVLLCKTQMAHLSFVVWSQLARRREISRSIFFNDNWCTGDVIKQKSHFLWSCGLVPLCLTTSISTINSRCPMFHLRKIILAYHLDRPPMCNLCFYLILDRKIILLCPLDNLTYFTFFHYEK